MLSTRCPEPPPPTRFHEQVLGSKNYASKVHVRAGFRDITSAKAVAAATLGANIEVVAVDMADATVDNSRLGSGRPAMTFAPNSQEGARAEWTVLDVCGTQCHGG